MSMCKNHSFTYDHVIAVTNRELSLRPYFEQIERICSCHPKAILLREKDLSQEEYCRMAKQVLNICMQYEVSCILHSFIDVAKELNHPMIHLPLHILQEYPETVKQFSVVGASIHSKEEAKEAQMLGASYLTAGHIYETDCKKGLPGRGLDFLEEVCQSVSIPVYAIGGIKPGEKEMQQLIDRGAAGGCIMSGMMQLK